jgi:ataxia telangiectasia mutated family protein
MYKTDGEVHTPSVQTIGGLAGRSLLMGHVKEYSKNPELGVRILVMGKLVQQSATYDYRLRTTTFEVLQSTLPIFQEMVQEKRASVPNEIRDLIVYLVPNTSASPVQNVDLGVLVEDASGSAWVFKSRAHRTWAKDLALMLGTLASHDDPFYACLRPLLSSDSNAAIELLPYLVQAVLTCAATKHEEETARRADILTQQFTQVLQFPMAATETLEAIISIILHLRHFSPPYGTGELAYNHWLAINPIVLSEAAGRCGAYASSLLFLEMAKDRDDVGDVNLDLSTARVQKVSCAMFIAELTTDHVRHLRQRRGPRWLLRCSERQCDGLSAPPSGS